VSRRPSATPTRGARVRHALERAAGGVMLRFAGWLVALALVALPIVGVVNGWFAADRWPFRQLRIDAAFERVNVEQVRAAVTAHLGVGFFAVDLGAVRHAIEQVPWVEAVEVRKRWPDLLEVRLVERRAAASWGDGRLVSSAGELFAVPGAAPEGLPLLSGPDHRAAEVLAFHRDAVTAFERTGMMPAALSLSGRGSWTLSLASGPRIAIGHEAPRERLHRFIELLPRTEAAGTALVHADLRYDNGFAIQWQTIAPQAPPGPAPTPIPEPAPVVAPAPAPPTEA
jgi:cell division protein FtsQ